MRVLLLRILLNNGVHPRLPNILNMSSLGVVDVDNSHRGESSTHLRDMMEECALVVHRVCKSIEILDEFSAAETEIFAISSIGELKRVQIFP